MLVKAHGHVLAANDHRHAARTRDSDHFIQSVAVFANVKLNVLDSLSRKELLRLATVVSSRETVNLDLLHSRLLLGFMLLVCLPAFGVRFPVNFITPSATRHGSACIKSDAKFGLIGITHFIEPKSTRAARGKIKIAYVNTLQGSIPSAFL
jgi:hypothetical protein